MSSPRLDVTREPSPRSWREWSIAIYSGDSPVDLRPIDPANKPVLTRKDVTDVPARLVADPFMIRVKACWYMFFEVLNLKTGRGEIGCATSQDGLSWRYSRIVLAEPFHLSYPYVFEWEGRQYMIPESHQAGSVRLYEATRFPTEWTLVDEILRGPHFADASIFCHAGRWWLFVETNPAFKHDTLRLYHAESPLGPWVEHPASPVILGNGHIARPAGRVVVAGDLLVRYTQDCDPTYGTKVRAFQITELTPERYAERPALDQPLLSGGSAAWNRDGMHHVDAHLVDGRWMACVDGWIGVAGAGPRVTTGRRTPLREVTKATAVRLAGYDLPDFLIIGAQKCGTTSLYSYLTEHPCVHAASVKEVGYFDRYYDRGLDWYRSQFPSRLRKYYERVVRRRPFLTGEASSGYILNPHSLGRIADVLPSAKLILILRNPVDRAYSHYQHTVRMGVETLPFAEAIAEEPARIREAWQALLEGIDYPDLTLAWFAYLRVGLYAEQVKVLLERVPRERVLIVSYEEFFADPRSSYARVVEWLGLPAWQPRDFGKLNRGDGGALSGPLREQLVEYFRPHNAELYELLGRRLGWDR